MYDRVIWSADVPHEEALMGYLDGMPSLEQVKLDRLMLTREGLDILSHVRDRGISVFADAKIIEIPSKMEEIAWLHLVHRPWMLNCMAGGVSSEVWEHDDPEKVDGLKRFAAACHTAGTRPCAVTVLTSKTPEVVDKEFNGRSNTEQVLLYVEMLLEAGFTDIVCSPKEISVIRSESRFNNLDINTPGIRPAGADVGDQARTDTPEAAIAAGATRLVIGRPLTNGNPAENLENIVAGLMAAA